MKAIEVLPFCTIVCLNSFYLNISLTLRLLKTALI